MECAELAREGVDTDRDLDCGFVDPSHEESDVEVVAGFADVDDGDGLEGGVENEIECDPAPGLGVEEFEVAFGGDREDPCGVVDQGRCRDVSEARHDRGRRRPPAAGASVQRQVGAAGGSGERRLGGIVEGDGSVGRGHLWPAPGFQARVLATNPRGYDHSLLGRWT